MLVYLLQEYLLLSILIIQKLLKLKLANNLILLN